MAYFAYLMEYHSYLIHFNWVEFDSFKEPSHGRTIQEIDIFDFKVVPSLVKEKGVPSKDNKENLVLGASYHMDQVLPFMRTFSIISTVHH